MSEFGGSPELAEAKHKLQQVRMRHDIELRESGIAESVFQSDARNIIPVAELYQHAALRGIVPPVTFAAALTLLEGPDFTQPERPEHPPHEGTEIGVYKRCLGSGQDIIALYRKDRYGTGFRYYIADVARRGHEPGSSIQEGLVAKGIRIEDAQRIGEMADELILLRDSGEIPFPLLDSDLLSQ